MTQRFGWISPKILIEDTLQAGYAGLRAILDDDAQIDAYLQRAFWNATPERRLSYRTKLRESRKIPILENYPRENQVFPCHAIIIGGGRSKSVLGNAGCEVTFPDGEVGAIPMEVWTNTIGVLTYAENTDELELYHQLAKLILAAARLELSEYFSYEHDMEEKDLGFDRNMQPRFVYHRVLEQIVEYEQFNAAAPVPVQVDSIASELLTQEDPDA